MRKEIDIFFIEFVSLSSSYGVGTYSKVLLNQLYKYNTNNRIHLVKIGFAKNGVVIKHPTSNNQVKIVEIFFRSNSPEFAEQFDFKISPLMAAACLSIIKQEKRPNSTPIIHVNSILHQEIAVLTKQINWKLVYTQHISTWRIVYNNNLIKFQNSIANGELKENIKKEIELCNLCDRIICLNIESKNIIRTIYKISKEKVYLIYNGVEKLNSAGLINNTSIKEKFGFDINDFIITFVGRLHQDKGIFELIEVFKMLSNNKTNLKLIIIGDGEIKKVLQTCQEICGKVAIFGFTEASIVSEIYKITNLGILPSYHEQSSFTVLEMMINKIPIIVTDTPGFEIFKNKKHLLKTKVFNDKRGDLRININNLYNNLELLCDNGTVRTKLANEAFKLVTTKYTAEQMRSDTCQVYEESIGKY